MRHFALPCSPAALSLGVAERPAQRALIARTSAPQRLAPAHRRTRSGAADLSVVAALAEAHLHAALSAVVQPVGRLGQRPHGCLPKHWTAPGKAGIKGSPTRLPQALRTRARESDANQTPGPSSIYPLACSIAEDSNLPPTGGRPRFGFADERKTKKSDAQNRAVDEINQR